MNDNESGNELFNDLIEDDAQTLEPGMEDLVPDLEEDHENQPDEDDFELTGMAQVDDPEWDDEEDDDENHQSQAFTEDNELINSLLDAKGIKDGKVQYEDEDGNLEEVDFYSLPKDEQLAILNSSDKDINFGLEQGEIAAINFLRENGVSFDEAMDYYKKQAVQEYIDSQNIAGIEVNQYSDEELYALDLRSKYEELTDEEIEIELQKQLEHPDLFKKKVDKLRTDYKEIEEKQLTDAKLQSQREEETKYNELKDNLIDIATSYTDIGGLDLDNDDKNEVLSHILNKDINGVSDFIKSLDSPKQLFELAWFATKGKDAFDIIHDHYKKVIADVSKTSYTKGKTDAAKAAPGTDRKSYTRQNAQPSRNTKQAPKDNLFADLLKD